MISEPALRLQSLHPFKSLLLSETTGSESKVDVAAIAHKMIDLIGDRENVADIVDGDPTNGVEEFDEVAFFYYKERSPAPWTDDPDFVDVLNHLAVICRRGRQL